MTRSQHDDDHHGGFRRDFPLLTRRRVVAVLGLAGIGAAVAALAQNGPPPSHPEANVTGLAADGGVCVKDPVETSGPFPADGTNAKAGQTVNALTTSGVVRQDIRGSFGPLSGVAEGVMLTLEIALVDVGHACTPLAGHAVYVWHANAEGQYSLYDLPGQNYLRGVGVTDAAGRVTFTTILPGCYDGRWPHVHFEVFASLETAVSGEKSLLISQFAMPAAEVAAIYASDARYPASSDNLARVTVASDNVFGDNTAEQIAVQTPKISGDAVAGLTAQVTVGIVS